MQTETDFQLQNKFLWFYTSQQDAGRDACSRQHSREGAIRELGGLSTITSLIANCQGSSSKSNLKSLYSSYGNCLGAVRRCEEWDVCLCVCWGRLGVMTATGKRWRGGLGHMESQTNSLSFLVFPRAPERQRLDANLQPGLQPALRYLANQQRVTSKIRCIFLCLFFPASYTRFFFPSLLFVIMTQTVVFSQTIRCL